MKFDVEVKKKTYLAFFHPRLVSIGKAQKNYVLFMVNNLKVIIPWCFILINFTKITHLF